MTKRLILGNRSGQYGLWVAKNGKDAMSSNPADFVFQMGYRAARPFAKGTLSAMPRTYFASAGVAIGATYTFTFNHGLGYAPLFFASVYPRAVGGVGTLGVVNAGAYYYDTVGALADAASLNIYVNVKHWSSSGGFNPPLSLSIRPVSWTIYREPA